MLQTFSKLQINNVFLDLGNVDIYRGLAKQAGLSEEVESQLFDMLQRKAVTEINELLGSLSLDGDMKTMLAGLTMLNGDKAVFEKARVLLAKADKTVLDAIDYLEKTAELCQQQFGDIKMHFDLSELQGYHYKTGVVFAAFVPQLGQAIARGGRYDDIGEIFGRARAATGFSTDLKILNQLSDIQFPVKEKILAPAGDDEALIDKVAELRMQGRVVIKQLPGNNADAAEMGCNKSLCLIDGQWTIKD